MAAADPRGDAASGAHRAARSPTCCSTTGSRWGGCALRRGVPAASSSATSRGRTSTSPGRRSTRAAPWGHVTVGRHRVRHRHPGGVRRPRSSSPTAGPPASASVASSRPYDGAASGPAVVVPHPRRDRRPPRRRTTARRGGSRSRCAHSHGRDPAPGPLAVVGDQQQRHVADRGARLDEALDPAAASGRTPCRCCCVGAVGGAHPGRPGARDVAGRRPACRVPRRKRSSKPMPPSVPRCYRASVARGPVWTAAVGGSAQDAAGHPAREHVGRGRTRRGRRPDEFDVVILGAGSGGYACALRAAQLGLTVALVEKGKLGGTCLHVGCIPTKALLHAAEVADSARESEQFGVRRRLDGIDMDGRQLLQGRRRRPALQGPHRADQGPRHHRGRGQRPADRPDAGRGRRRRAYTGRNVVLASGSYSRTLPGLEIDGERVLTSEHALRPRPRARRRSIVLGGGVIGCEFASVWKSFGADVTIVEALPRLVAAEDEDVVQGPRARLPQAQDRLPHRHAVRVASSTPTPG